MINKLYNYEFNFLNLNLSGKKLVKHPLFAGSAIMVFGSNITNFIAYVYHLIIGRMLGPADYSVLASVLSILGLVTTAYSFLGLVIVKFVSSADAKEKKAIYVWFGNKVRKMGIILFISSLLLSPLISNFLHVDYLVILVITPIFLISVHSFFYRAFLQGLLKFKQIVLSTSLDMLGRLVLGILAIIAGFSVAGVVAGIVISSAVVLFILRWFLRDYREETKAGEFKGGRKVFSYTIPVLVATLAIQSFFSTDVILVKHFFSAHDAGIYASLSTLGKIIFYGTAPISAVMFPMVSQRHAKGHSYKKIIIISLLMTGGVAFAVTGIYYLFPDLMVRVLYGSGFLEAAPYLYLFGIFMSVFTLSSLLANYFLSRDRTWVSYTLVIMAVLQAAGIWFFHRSITEVIKVSIISVSILFAGLLIYLINETRNKAAE